MNILETDFESDVRSQIMIWGYSNNERLILDGKDPLRFDTFEELAKSYWESYLNDSDSR
jgi:hypothetical protein